MNCIKSLSYSEPNRKAQKMRIDKKFNQLFRILTDTCRMPTITLAPSVSQCLTTPQKTQGHRVHEWCIHKPHPIIIPTKWSLLLLSSWAFLVIVLLAALAFLSKLFH